jgi:hypothetical protein
MTDKQERNQKESGFYEAICPHQAQHLQNTSLQHYCYANPFGIPSLRQHIASVKIPLQCKYIMQEIATMKQDKKKGKVVPVLN